MVALIFFLLSLGASLFKPKSWLEAENAALRQQLIVLQRQVRGRVQFTNSDRLNPMRAITTRRELIAPWLRMRRSLAQFSGSDALCRMPWSAGCIINTSESKFSVHTRIAALTA